MSGRGILAWIAILGPAYFGLVVLLLSLFDTDYNSITQVASDYGVGRYAVEMNVGFLVGGIGLIAFSLTLARLTGHLRSRAAPAFLFIAGSVLIMDSYFHTNLEGTQATLGATIHGFGGLFFFITAPIGMLLVTRKLGRGIFLITLIALVAGFILLAASSVPSVNAGGLAERVIIEVILSSVIYASMRLS